jgi:copper(I)-binding protein
VKAGVAKAGAVATALAATVLASGCAAGQYAQSATEQETIDGTSVRIGTTITIGGLALETPTDGVAWKKGSSVPLKAVIANSGQKDDSLTNITSSSIGGWSVYNSVAQASGAQASPSAGSGSSTPSPIKVQAHSAVQFGTQHAEGTLGNRVILLTGVKSDLTPGSVVTITFTFARAGSVTARVPVQLTKSPQTSVIPGPSATGQVG